MMWAVFLSSKPLNEAELAQLLEACNMALDLCDAKNKIFDYVESRMFFLSPNLTHICGANTAAKMMGGVFSTFPSSRSLAILGSPCLPVFFCSNGANTSLCGLDLPRVSGSAGGLTALSKMPACNILVRTVFPCHDALHSAGCTILAALVT